MFFFYYLIELERKLLKQFAQFDARYKLARTTHRVSVFTEGILNMKVTLLGVIEVEPTVLLEEGIRKELVFRIAEALHREMDFQLPAKMKKKKKQQINVPFFCWALFYLFIVEVFFSFSDISVCLFSSNQNTITIFVPFKQKQRKCLRKN